MKVPATLAELEDLIRLEAQEDLHLEFKDSRALDPSKKSEIAKDVSAFANSDGGIMIYGIREKGHLPEAIDQGAEDAKINREWIEQVILSNISPAIANTISATTSWQSPWRITRYQTFDLDQLPSRRLWR